MANKPLHPYMRPVLRSFENKEFLSQSRVIFKFLTETTLRKVRGAQDKDWVFIHEGAKASQGSQKKRGWLPKIYVCISSKDYWSVVSDIILLSQIAKFNWKFCKNFNLFGRPDKIVIYCGSLSDIKRIIRLIRPILKGKKFHSLQFAEKRDQGIFIGTDPEFLKVSWRYYRWAIGEAIIKGYLKKGQISNDTKLALEKLNISLKHQGPRTLIPDKKNNPFIKKIWKEVTS